MLFRYYIFIMLCIFKIYTIKTAQPDTTPTAPKTGLPLELEVAQRLGITQTLPPLHRAAFAGNLEQIRKLASRTTIKEIDPITGSTPLFLAAQAGHYQATDLLLSNEPMLLVVEYTISKISNTPKSPLLTPTLMPPSAPSPFLTPTYSSPHTPLATSSKNTAICDTIVCIFFQEEGDLANLPSLLNTEISTSKTFPIKSGKENFLHTPDFLAASKTCLVEIMAKCNKIYSPESISIDLKQFQPILLEKQTTLQMACQQDGLTPLHIAAQNGHYEITNLLLTFLNNYYLHQHINTLSKKGETPLFLAAQNGKINIVRLFLEQHAAIDIARPTDGITPLFISIENGYTEIFKLLLQAGANYTVTRMSDGLTLLMLVAQQGHTDLIYHMTQKKEFINQQTKDGKTALFFAIEHNRIKTAKILLLYHADPNISATNGRSPLHVAAEKGNLALVRLLLCNRANPNISTTTGITPLHLSAQQGHFDIVKQLVIQGANIAAQTAAPDNLLASDKTTTEIKDYLTKIAPATKRATLSLLRAARENNRKEVISALDSGADINASLAPSGNTALHEATTHENIQIVTHLLTSQAIVDVQNMDGNTPLHLALEKNNQDIAQLLLRWHANIKIKNYEDQTPATIAERNGIAHILFEHEAPKAFLDSSFPSTKQPKKLERKVHSSICSIC